MTVEAAVALAALTVVLVACLSGISCLLAQLRCDDAAHEAARLAARGDTPAARSAVSALAPAGAALSLSDSDPVTATVTVRALGGLLPGVVLSASAIAARESAPAP